MTGAGPWRRWVVSIALFAVSLLATAVILEGVLALMRINTRHGLRFVPGRGITYIPHAYYTHRKEGFSEGRFNSHGFRDYERTIEKPPGTFRILVLGDSYVDALQVALEDTFTARLEGLLDEAPGPPEAFEVLSLGQGGFGTTDALMRYRNFGREFDPDVVLLAFLTGNDYRNNHRELNGSSFGYYYSLSPEGRLTLDSSIMDAYERSLTLPKRAYVAVKTRSYLVSLISQRLHLLSTGTRPGRGSRWEGREVEDGQPGEFSDLDIYLPDAGPMLEEAFVITEKVLDQFNREVITDGRRFVLVTLSNAEQVTPEIWPDVERRLGATPDFDRPDALIRGMAASAGIPLLQLAPSFLRHSRATGENLHGFGGLLTGHWNERGHALAAMEIHQFLLDQGLLPGVDPLRKAEGDSGTPR